MNIVKDRESGDPRGFAFVTYGSKEDAKAAADGCDGEEVCGRNVTVAVARPRGEGGRGGGDRGRGGGHYNMYYF